MILSTQNGFYGKSHPMPRKMPVSLPKTEKNTEKSIAKEHFPWNGEPKTKAM